MAAVVDVRSRRRTMDGTRRQKDRNERTEAVAASLDFVFRRVDKRMTKRVKRQTGKKEGECVLTHKERD
jgi:hypothetical protein